MAAPEETYHEEIWRRAEESPPEYRPGLNLRLDEAIAMIVPGQRFLDIGCGMGILGREVRGRFESTYGIDVSPTAIAHARATGNEAELVNLNSQPLPWKDGFFDTITAMVVLLLLYDPGQALDECRRVLRPGGDLILSLPNMRTWWRIARLTVGGRFPRVSKHDIGDDGGTLHYYCYRDMCALLEAHGFAVVEARGVYTIPALATRLPNRGLIGWLKREWLSAEIVIRARPS